MAVNGTDLLNDPFNTTLSPFTGFFSDMGINGMVFFLFPLIILTVALYIKTENPTATSMFMIISGALLGSGGIFVGSMEVSILFYTFATLGIIGVILSVFFQRRG